MLYRHVLSTVLRAALGAFTPLAVSFAIAPAAAQTADSRSALSLDQAVTLAIERSRLVAANRAQTEASRQMHSWHAVADKPLSHFP